MNILINVMLTVYVIVALLMVFVILMQRPKSEGLGAAFGGGVTENIFGAQTTNVLTKITGWLAGIFFLLTFFLSILYAHRSTGDSSLRRELMKGQPASAAAPGTSAPPAQPGPSSAVGAPGTVTNPTPGAPPAGSAAPEAAPVAGAPSAAEPTAPVKPSDMAVGAVPPATASPAPNSP